MLLRIGTSFEPATDLGYLLHKHPDKVQTFPLKQGTATVWFPVATQERCDCALHVDLDPISLVRGRSPEQQGASGLLEQYVNDRPWVASSYLAVAIAEVFGTALSGRCVHRPDLVGRELPWEVSLPVVPARRGGAAFLRSLFEPLGWSVTTTAIPLDSHWPSWGDSACVGLRLEGIMRLKDVLDHLYVLLPVLDGAKHYYIGDAEREKLIRHGRDWLERHPLKERIVRRYLLDRSGLVKSTLRRLEEESEDESVGREDTVTSQEAGSPATARKGHLDRLRREAVLDVLASVAVSSVADLGCGEGRLLHLLRHLPGMDRVVGVDVSTRALEVAARRLRLGRESNGARGKLELLHGSLVYADPRLHGLDAAVLVEVLEHIDPDRLPFLEANVFGKIQPRLVVVTTPNREYNECCEELTNSGLRHSDHRFEWTRGEFAAWAERMASSYGYEWRWRAIGEEHPEFGSPTQMAVFRRKGVSWN